MTHSIHHELPDRPFASQPASRFPTLDDLLPILSKSKQRFHVNHIKMNRQPLSTRLTVTVTAVSTVAFVVSCYLSWVGITSTKVAGCDGGVFDCSHVMTSRWSQVLGIPVGVPAAALYGLVLIAIAALHVASRRWQKRLVATIWVLSLAAFLSAVWFVSIQITSIGRLCPYCLAVHACGLVMAALMWFATGISRVTKVQLSGLSVIMVAGLIVTQLLSEGPQTFVIEESAPAASELIPASDDVFEAPAPDLFDAPTEFDPPQAQITMPPAAITEIVSVLSSPTPWIGLLMAPQEAAQDAAQKVDSEAAPAESKKMVSIMSGTTMLDANRWPLWGNASSDKVVVEMFDYTCLHCRNTHRAIKDASAQLGGDLAVVALPVPLHRACNDAATSSSLERAGACEIARIAVAVWLVDRSKFSEYHDWLFEQLRTTEEARRHAEALVGAQPLAAELAKTTASQYIAKHVLLYKKLGSGIVPKLIFPTTTVVGEVSSGSTLANMVREKL